MRELEYGRLDVRCGRLDVRCERLELRPHHGLCSAFFRGKGYSEEFTENMKAVLDRLNGGNVLVTLTAGADVICEVCPHNKDGECETSEKVRRYDAAVLKMCGLSAGETISWQDFKARVQENIVAAGRLSEVCGDCAWFGLCSGILTG